MVGLHTLSARVGDDEPGTPYTTVSSSLEGYGASEWVAAGLGMMLEFLHVRDPGVRAVFNSSICR